MLSFLSALILIAGVIYLLQILKTAVRATKSSLKPTNGIKSGNRSKGIIKYANAAINETLTCAGVKGSMAISKTSRAGFAIVLPAFIKILIKAGRTIAKPALEVLEMALDPYTPAQVRVSLMAALAYLIMPFDLFPDFMPVVGFSDDFVALTAVLSIWSKYMTPSIRARAENKLNKLFPFY